MSFLAVTIFVRHDVVLTNALGLRPVTVRSAITDGAKLPSSANILSSCYSTSKYVCLTFAGLRVRPMFQEHYSGFDLLDQVQTYSYLLCSLWNSSAVVYYETQWL